jgi:hypothetical protein
MLEKPVNKLIMENLIFRNATINDVPFLATAIIEAEKSGTDKLSYSTIFGLTEEEVRSYLEDMLYEEIDGCELSISSFIIAEYNGKQAGALSAWIEGKEGIPSAILKGNLLSHILPKKCIERAAALNTMLHEIYIEYVPNTIQIGAGYVAPEYRGHRIHGMLHQEIIDRRSKENPEITKVLSQTFDCNAPSLRSKEKTEYTVLETKESSNQEILNYLPSNKKVVMMKEIITN